MTNGPERFTGSFTQQEPIPEEGIAAAVEVMRSGRLHRYNTAPGEVGEVALLEQEFAAMTGAKYCLAVASGGAAMTTALRAAGVRPGDPVLTNAFTLAPVPGAIAAVGAVPLYVEVTEGLVIDLGDLETRLGQASVLLLSHMRGHICDMDRLMALCTRAGVLVIEDCAHTMGANWNGVPSGRHGVMGCFSTQTYKHINSGEGGFLISDDDEMMARAIIGSGSYMLYGRHLAAPPAAVFEDLRFEVPNVSSRMDNLRAALLRPQLRKIETQAKRWNARHAVVEEGLRATPGLSLVERPAQEGYVASSFQFLLTGWAEEDVRSVLSRCAARGVELKWFGNADPVAFTSRYDSWRYAPVPELPRTDRVLAGLLDLRLPLTFSLEDCAMIARIIRQEVSIVWQARAGSSRPGAMG
ncbi:DegT/DnrJ/EryC1/StrS family aminotransferase [Roseisalinus antarcticus]|uniref:dTDP-3-amino-3, 6-dideoxy-alpha-D-galactopyranose transaminase n=1 Tax=Roseisalinus antarcticus TaxID=254357 RepID=A0A1Y5SML5_9RHOB|nr:aminotransferase class I/II-fold pyridoxal phosphate-dependent enzyme [Roseisalinus antarcticus]SLN41124.1 dTDP-3-amino-3, 6-dideoxy-alpha-D-galactopyranose transaminase [Roseisalinus antarcticus]